MAAYQILVPIIGLIFLGYSVWQHFRGRNTLTEVLGWVLFWVFVATVALFPAATTERLAKWLGFKSNVNALLVMGMGILFFFLLRLYFLLKRQNIIITRLVRELALKEEELEKREGKP